MGVQLGDLVHPTEVALPTLRGKRLALDAYNMFYQFLATIRQPDGQPFTAPDGAITSHLVGILYRTSSLLTNGILPVLVFDGKPLELKAATLRVRALAKARAEQQWEEALAAGDLERAKKKAGATSRMTPEMSDRAKELASLLGVPVVQAPSEGEAQATHMARKGEVWGVASEDYDNLLFGAPRLVKGLAALRTVGSNPGTVRVIETAQVLRDLDVTQEELVVMGMLMGTDFNEGFTGIGPKKALKLIHEHLGYEATVRKVGGDPETLLPVRAIFQSPPSTDDYSLQWKSPDADRLRTFLVTENGFEASRVERVIDRLRNLPPPTTARQSALDAFGEGA